MLLAVVGLPQALSKKMMYRIIQIGLFITIVLISCKRDVEVFESGTEYYPIRSTGSYIIYDVHQINYNASGRDTLNFQLMEMMGDTVTLNGRLYYKILRYKRTADSAAWPLQPDSVWRTYKDVSKAVKNENNIDIIKMVFPVDEGKAWDADGFNTWGSQIYSMRKKAYPYNVNNHYFANTLTVQEKFDTSAINKNISFEVYAKDIGLIHRSVNNLQLCQSSSSCIINHDQGNDSIVSGFKYEQRFNSFQ
jgi:hypothetical protein